MFLEREYSVFHRMLFHSKIKRKRVKKRERESNETKEKEKWYQAYVGESAEDARNSLFSGENKIMSKIQCNLNFDTLFGSSCIGLCSLFSVFTAMVLIKHLPFYTTNSVTFSTFHMLGIDNNIYTYIHRMQTHSTQSVDHENKREEMKLHGAK